MRFHHLDLIRYGALTDKRLEFSASSNLHIVYGPNEAGKSSALSAIADLLFGYPRATAHYSFLHDPGQLRIGAAIEKKDGDLLRFRRRRGVKNTLLADDDKETALREDALLPYLGSLNREIFKRAFGLDSKDLREGGRAMLESGGEIGTLLFSAASGLLGLRRLRQTLDDEAGQIFGTRKKQDHRFFQAVDRYDNARRSEGQLELKATDWKKLLGEAAELEAQIAALQTERQKTKTELERLRVLKKLQPLVLEIDREAAALAAFDDLAAIPQGFAADLTEALSLRRSASETMRREGEAVEQLSQESDGIVVNGDILAAASEITELFSQTGAYTKAKRDLPAIEREVGNYDAMLAQIARRLGLSDAEELESRQPSDADLARLKRLVDNGQALRRAAADLTRQLAAEREHLSALDEEADAGRLIDPKPYAEQLAALSTDLTALSRLDELQVQLDRARDNLRLSARRMKPAVNDADFVFSQPWPDLSEIARLGDRLESLAHERRAIQSRLSSLSTEADEIAAELRADEQSGAIVTPEQIAGARARRDDHYARLGANSTDAERTLVADLIAYADRLADAARDNADRLSRHAEARLRLSRIEKQSEQASAGLQSLETQSQRARAEFEALFAGLDIVPLDPPAMLDWRRGLDDLAKQRASIEALEDQIAVTNRTGEQIAPVLQAIADATGAQTEGLPILTLARAVTRQIDALTQHWNDSRSRDGERRASARRVESIEAKQAELDRQMEDWQDHFAAACSVAGLKFESGATEADADIAMAQAALDAWRNVPELLLERTNRRRRVAGMQRDNRAYEERVAAIVAVADPALQGLSADAAISLIHEAAIAARSADQKRRALTENLQQATARLHRAESILTASQSRVEILAQSLPNDDFDGILARLSERARHAERLDECRQRLFSQSEGRSETQLRDMLADFDSVAAELQIESLAEEENRQFERHGELVARRSQNQREREALESGTNAEYAVFEKQAAEEDARDLARQWVVLKLASSMLARSVEAYRERHADPVMQRAGEHFAALTGARFKRLLQEYDERDELRLLLERSNGERVPLEGLSEGTGDQLFLALRLAFLEDYAGRNEPAPFIIDDIFQTFDDERTIFGLHALAATGEKFQTIVFTHQASVVELAQRELGQRADIIRL